MKKTINVTFEIIINDKNTKYCCNTNEWCDYHVGWGECRVFRKQREFTAECGEFLRCDECIKSEKEVIV